MHIIVIPYQFRYSTLGVLEANGSSATGNCSDVPSWHTLSTCSSPASSVLFDGVIPTLTALDGNTWARQLMILQRAIYGDNSFQIYSSFHNTYYTWIRRVEVVLFNCPQWGTAVDKIDVAFYRYHSRARYPNYYEDSYYPTVFSCDSLIKMYMCFPHHEDFASTPNKARLRFYTSQQYVHIAEVSFYNDTSPYGPCPRPTLIPGNWIPPQGRHSILTGHYSSHTLHVLNRELAVFMASL